MIKLYCDMPFFSPIAISPWSESSPSALLKDTSVGRCGLHEGRVVGGVPSTAVDGLPHDGDQQVGHHAGVEGQVVGDHLGQGGEGRR